MYTMVGCLSMLVTPTILLGIVLALSINITITVIIKLAFPSWYEIIENDVTHDIVHDAVKETLRKTHLIRIRSEQTFDEFKREVEDMKKNLRGKE